MNNVNPDICHEVRKLLHECGKSRPLSVESIYVYIRDAERLEKTIVVKSDVATHLAHLEREGEVARVPNPDNPTLHTWTLTDAGRVRVAQS